MSQKRSNWLLRGLIILSMGIHGVIFMHISGLYRSRAVTAIELTLRDMSVPPARTIPRPRPRPRELPQPKEVGQAKVAVRPTPSFKPVKTEPPESSLPSGLVEKISVPEIPSVSSMSIGRWTPGKVEESSSGEYGTPNSYLEMVRLKIEKEKRYPEAARSRQIEGSVTVSFVITPEGHIKTLQIKERSRSQHLNEAALDAVKAAGPFPKPPRQFFKGDITLIVTIVFELT